MMLLFGVMIVFHLVHYVNLAIKKITNLIFVEQVHWIKNLHKLEKIIVLIKMNKELMVIKQLLITLIVKIIS